MHLISIAQATLIISIAACAGAHAADVELLLSNGEQVVGEITSETDTMYTLQQKVQVGNDSIIAKKIYLKKNILKVTGATESSDPKVQFAARQNSAPKTADGQRSLLTWCISKKMIPEGVQAANGLLTYAPDDKQAMEYLAEQGCVQIGNEWVLESKFLEQQGKVRIGNKIVTKEEAATLKQEGKDKTNKSMALRKIEVLKLEQARLKRATETDQVQLLENENTQLTSQLDWAKQAIASALDANTAAREASAQVTRDRGDASSRKSASERVGQTATELKNRQNAFDKMQGRINEISKAVVQAKIDQTRAKTRIPEIEKEIAAQEAIAAASSAPTTTP